MFSSARFRYYHSVKRRSTSAALICCFATNGGGNAAVSAFSTMIASMLRDPSLLDDRRIHRNGDGDGDSSSFFDVVDPGSSSGRDVIARVRGMGREDAVLAIDRAYSALVGWRDGTTASRRSSLLYRWSTLIRDNVDDVAMIMTLESGKPLHESRGEVEYGASFLDYYAAEALRPNSAGGGIVCPTPFSTSVGGMPKGRILAMNEAVGVCGLITPWNFPIAMITRKAGPALAAGCTVVLKPSDLTPLTAVALSVLADRAGMPRGVFELITTDGGKSTSDVGEEMCTNTIVRKISFTGSTPVGKLLMRHSSDTVKRLSLELGGNAAFIVFEDADIDLAVDGAMASKFRNAGQTCVCADRFVVHRSVEDEFVSKLADRVRRLTVGHGTTDGVTMGPVISAARVKILKDRVDDAISEGATCVVGGSPLAELGPNYFSPTILTNVCTRSSIWHGENFGPIVAVRTFDTEEEAILLANDTRTGLASYFFTRDMSRVFRVSSALENGIVGVNEGIISTASAPFGGVKESGLGREGSSAGINEYLETKYVFLNA